MSAYVYRHFDSAGNLLYVGCTNNPKRREIVRRSQGTATEWIDSIHRTDLVEYVSRAEALRAESLAIATESPIHNVIGKPRPVRMTTATTTLLTVAQAAQELHITRRAVIHRIHAGTLSASKIGDGPTSAYVITRDEIQRAKREAAA